MPSSLLPSSSAAQVNKKRLLYTVQEPFYVAQATDNLFFLFIPLLFFYTEKKGGFVVRFLFSVLCISIIPLFLFGCAPASSQATFSSSETSSSSELESESESFSSTLDPSEEGYIAGNSHGFTDGRSDGFDAGTSDGEQIPSESLDFGDTYESGYTVGYNRAYAKWWLTGYLEAYLSQHPEIDEYDLIDDVIRCFPDADVSDMIDYLRSAQ